MRRCTEPGGDHSGDSSPKLAKDVFHAMECHVQYWNREEFPGRDQLLLRAGLGVSQQVVSNSIVFLGFNL